jgi:hypothetical protein
MFKFTKKKKVLNFDIRISDLFRLPARSRSGEGRDFDIRISDFFLRSQNGSPAVITFCIVLSLDIH